MSQVVPLFVKTSCLDTSNKTGYVEEISLSECRNVVVRNKVFKTRYGYKEEFKLPNEEHINAIVQFSPGSGSSKIVVITDKLYLYDTATGQFKTDGVVLFSNPKLRVSYTVFRSKLYFTNGTAENADGSLDGMFSYNGNLSATADRFRPEIQKPGDPVKTIVGAKQFEVVSSLFLIFGPTEKDPSSGSPIYQACRVRWSRNRGSDSWLSKEGYGSWIDCPTVDGMISVNRIGEKFLVFFDKEVWSLISASDPYLVFSWVLVLRDTRACFGVGSCFSNKNTSIFSVGIDGIYQTTIVEKTQRLLPTKTDLRINDLVQERFLSMTQTDYSPLVYVDSEQFQTIFCFQNESLVFSTVDDTITSFDRTFKSFGDVVWRTEEKLKSLKKPFNFYGGYRFSDYRANDVHKKFLGGFNGEIFSITRSPYDTYLSGETKKITGYMKSNPFGANLLVGRILSLKVKGILGRRGMVSWGFYKDGKVSRYIGSDEFYAARQSHLFIGVVAGGELDPVSKAILLKIELRYPSFVVDPKVFLYAEKGLDETTVNGFFRVRGVTEGDYNYEILPRDAGKIDLAKAGFPWLVFYSDPFENSMNLSIGRGNAALIHEFDLSFSGESVGLRSIQASLAQVKNP